MKTVHEVQEWLQSLLKFGVKPGLERIEWLLERTGRPDRRLKLVHVAGTNGKGSVITYMRSVLEEAGYEVGTFTSPYIDVFNERIAVNNRPIDDDSLVQIANFVQPLVEECAEEGLGNPTEFEVLTLMAFIYFAEVAYPDIVLVETGLGGRLDSTNCIIPVLTVITNIGHDHMGILGNSIEEITREKAGIMKNGIRLVTAVKQPEAKQIINTIAKEKKINVYALEEQFSVEDVKQGAKETTFSYTSMFRSFENMAIQMKGTHQVENATVALMALDLLKVYFSLLIDEEHVYAGLKNAYWPGRFEQVKEEPLVILDGAHNEEGIQALVNTLQAQYSNQKIYTVFTALADKDIKKMIEPLEKISEQMFLTTFDFPRAATVEEIEQLTTKQLESFTSYTSALEEAEKHAKENDGIVVVAGSLYFISEVRKLYCK